MSLGSKLVRYTIWLSTFAVTIKSLVPDGYVYSVSAFWFSVLVLGFRDPKFASNVTVLFGRYPVKSWYFLLVLLYELVKLAVKFIIPPVVVKSWFFVKFSITHVSGVNSGRNSLKYKNAGLFSPHQLSFKFIFDHEPANVPTPVLYQSLLFTITLLVMLIFVGVPARHIAPPVPAVFSRNRLLSTIPFV